MVVHMQAIRVGIVEDNPVGCKVWTLYPTDGVYHLLSRWCLDVTAVYVPATTYTNLDWAHRPTYKIVLAGVPGTLAQRFGGSLFEPSDYACNPLGWTEEAP